MCPFLHLDFRKEYCWGSGCHRKLAGLSTANSVKNLRLLSRNQDAAHGGQRCADNIDTTHEFIWAPIWINSPHQHRQHLKGLRDGALRERETSLDIFEVQSVRLTLFLHLVDKLLTKLRVFDRARRGDDQVALASGR